jgi:hypothetical protein
MEMLPSGPDMGDVMLMTLSALGVPLSPFLVMTWPFTMLGGGMLFGVRFMGAF